MEMEDKVPYEIHGVISSDSDSDMESKKELDEEYHALKPPPVNYELIKHNIIKIPAKKPPPVKNIWEERMKQMANNKKGELMEENTEVTNIKKKKSKSRSAKKIQETLVPPNTPICGPNNILKEEKVKGLSKTGHQCQSPLPCTNINMNSNILEGKTPVLGEVIKKKRKKKKSTFTAVENNMFDETLTVSSSVRKAKKPSLKVGVKTNIKKIKTPNSLAKKKRKIAKKKKIQINIAELNNIEKNLDKLKWPDFWHAGMSEQTIGKEIKRLKEREQEIYENWCRQHRSLQQHKELDQSMVQQSNIENVRSAIQSNNFGIIIENKKRKKKKAKNKCQTNSENTHNDVKTNVKETTKNVEDKTITNLSNKRVVKPNLNFEGTSNTKIISPKTKTNQILGKSKKLVATETKREDYEQPRRINTDCNKQILPNISNIDNIGVVDRNNSKNMQGINMMPNKKSKFMAVHDKAKDKAHNHCKELINKELDNVTHDNVFGDGFRDYIQNICVDDGRIIPCLNNFNYEQLYRAFRAYQEKLINDQNKNVHKDNNTVSKNKSKTQTKLKLEQNNHGENKQPLHCLRNLNSEVRCHYYEFEGKNFQHFMNFRERYLYMSLEEAAVNEGAKRNKNSEKSKGKCDVYVIGLDNECHLSEKDNIAGNGITFHDALKDNVSCYYYDYEGKNFLDYMKFRENYLCMSVDDIQKRKNTEVKSITPLTKYNIRENYSDVQGYVLQKKYTTDDSYSTLLSKLIHIAFLVFLAYLTKIAMKNIGLWILEFHLYVCCFIGFLVFISFVKH